MVCLAPNKKYEMKSYVLESMSSLNEVSWYFDPSCDFIFFFFLNENQEQKKRKRKKKKGGNYNV